MKTVWMRFAMAFAVVTSCAVLAVPASASEAGGGLDAAQASSRRCTQTAHLVKYGAYVSARGAFSCTGRATEMKLTVSLFRKRWYGWQLLSSHVFPSNDPTTTISAAVPWNCTGTTYTYYTQVAGSFYGPHGWTGVGGSSADKARFAC